MFGDSKNSESPTIEDIFGLLDKWRHLPAYRLEPRADIYFALYLPEVLLKRFGSEIKKPLIPEFPIKDKEASGNFKRVDYFALSGKENAYLVKLKTDLASKDEEREKLLAHLVDENGKGLKPLVKDIITLACNKNRQIRNKYVHLLFHLRTLDLVSFNEEELYGIAFQNPSRGIYDILKNVKLASWICGHRPRLEALNIQPWHRKVDGTGGKDKTKVVDFREFAEIVESGSGYQEMRQSFACYLKKWAAEAEKAGSLDPRTLHCDRS